MFKIKFNNLSEIINQIDKLRKTPINYPSVFSTLKKMFLFFFYIYL